MLHTSIIVVRIKRHSNSRELVGYIYTQIGKCAREQQEARAGNRE